MEAEIKTIIDPKYEPYKKPDNKDNQEAGSINKTIKIYIQTNEKIPIPVLKKKTNYKYFQEIYSFSIQKFKFFSNSLHLHRTFV